MENRPGIVSIVLGWATGLYTGGVQGSPILELFVYSFIGGLAGALGGWLISHIKKNIKHLVNRRKALKRLKRIRKRNESSVTQ